ncbi:hypothetical protein [Spongorhabdus nitratireducens]
MRCFRKYRYLLSIPLAVSFQATGEQPVPGMPGAQMPYMPMQAGMAANGYDNYNLNQPPVNARHVQSDPYANTAGYDQYATDHYSSNGYPATPDTYGSQPAMQGMYNRNAGMETNGHYNDAMQGGMNDHSGQYQPQQYNNYQNSYQNSQGMNNSMPADMSRGMNSHLTDSSYNNYQQGNMPSNTDGYSNSFKDSHIVDSYSDSYAKPPHSTYNMQTGERIDTGMADSYHSMNQSGSGQNMLTEEERYAQPPASSSQYGSMQQGTSSYSDHGSYQPSPSAYDMSAASSGHMNNSMYNSPAAQQNSYTGQAMPDNRHQMSANTSGFEQPARQHQGYGGNAYNQPAWEQPATNTGYNQQYNTNALPSSTGSATGYAEPAWQQPAQPQYGTWQPSAPLPQVINNYGNHNTGYDNQASSGFQGRMDMPAVQAMPQRQPAPTYAPTHSAGQQVAAQQYPSNPMQPQLMPRQPMGMAMMNPGVMNKNRCQEVRRRRHIEINTVPNIVQQAPVSAMGSKDCFKPDENLFYNAVIAAQHKMGPNAMWYHQMRLDTESQIAQNCNMMAGSPNSPYGPQHPGASLMCRQQQFNQMMRPYESRYEDETILYLRQRKQLAEQLFFQCKGALASRRNMIPSGITLPIAYNDDQVSAFPDWYIRQNLEKDVAWAAKLHNMQASELVRDTLGAFCPGDMVYWITL